MTENLSTCPKSDLETVQNEEISKLSLDQGISVWGSNQEQLENQALKELDILSKNSNISNNVNIATVVNEEKNSEPTKPRDSTLDIASYIKRQEQLKKQKQKFISAKTSDVSERSRNAAKNICKRAQVQTDKIPIAQKQNTNHSNTAINCDKNGNQIAENHLGNDGKLNELEPTKKDSDHEYVPSELETDEGDYNPGTSGKSVQKKNKRKKVSIAKIKDDGLMKCYKKRLDLYYETMETQNELKVLDAADEGQEQEDDIKLQGGLKIQKTIWDKLYRYQQDGVKWLWKLQQEGTGGILGDEMGLGKTIQIISFLHSLEYSKIVSQKSFVGVGPTIIVCPLTIMHQWVQHFHEWAPEFRVAVLHQSGTFVGKKSKLIKEINSCKGILVTTYQGCLKYKGDILDYNWHYVILDEGHQIRNPNAKISVAVKEIRTPHRLMLTGSPMQNNLTELWSLFDFTNPGMLGNSSVFIEHFVNPIVQGGYANSTPMQEATSLSVATTLKRIIDPYLLRRTKAGVQHDIFLPNKTEQVLFCSMTKEQIDLYKGYLMSEHVNDILGRGVNKWYSDKHMRGNVLVAITTLRKICNHPDIYLHEADSCQDEDEIINSEDRFGHYKKSGKMIVVSALLKLWTAQKHRVLLFTQSRAMLLILKAFLEDQGYKYLKMDGSTSVNARQPLIAQFNEDDSYHVFLSTTRVGGLGVNLTGADRVIIFDPDWNPATDTQARERAWRIGQDKQVTIYRLLSAGTIEEKMYQRQVWKQLLSNKILIDPKSHRIFKSSDLLDLFSLQESPNSNPETTNIFRESRVKIEKRIMEQKAKKKKKTVEIPEEELKLSEDKVEKMKRLAHEIAMSMSQEKVSKSGYQKELEAERQQKLEERKELKKMSAAELFIYNRNKAKQEVGDSFNKIDDCDTKISFDQALEYSEHTAELYHDINNGKIKAEDLLVADEKSTDEPTEKKKDAKDSNNKRKRRSSDGDNNHSRSKRIKKKDKRSNSKDVTVDTSGELDGEKIEGLVKREITNKKKRSEECVTQKDDDYVLAKLFRKKGVSGALQHDSIVQGKRLENSLHIYSEAESRAEKSLAALRESQGKKWK